MLKFRQNIGIYALLGGLIGLNCFFIIQEQFWFLALPVILFVIWLTIFHTDKAILFLAFATPLSIKTDFKDYGLSINLPTEPLLIILMGLFFLKLIIDGKYDKQILKHPLTIAIIVNLAWVFVTALTSSMFFVSIKFFIARMWFIVVFYIMAIAIFKNEKTIRRFVWMFLFPLCFVIVYSLVRHYMHGWEHYYANYAPIPYFAGHGDYAAVLCLFLPFLIAFIVKPEVFAVTPNLRIIAILILCLFIAGIVASYARAAWLSLVAAGGVFFIFTLRIRLRTLLLVLVGVLAIGFIYKDNIYMKLRQNKKVSASDLSQHLKSVSNISTDASNTERINRWKSAWRMFKERPVTGWGPGTYMFQYAPFQLSRDKTIISTNTGALGNAHSEYIGPLADMGLLGPITFIIIILIMSYKAINLIYYGKTEFIRLTALAAFLGLVSYLTHGFVNNYLDTDKAAIPFWAFMAIITVLDIHYNRKETDPDYPKVS